MTDEVVFNASIDQLIENTPIGSIRRAIGNNLFGINMRQTPTAVPSARDSLGFTFFTRPQLNMSVSNVTNYRGFYNLLNDNAASYQRYTRLILDPRLAAIGASGRPEEPNATCPFVDPYSPWIPILTNNITSISGWPDLMAPIRTTDAGLYGEEISMVDGVTNHFESFDVDATFRNTRGNPLIYLFYIWIKYETLVYEGILTPYMDMILENEIDYQTRIYRLVLDQQKRYVSYIASTGASFPMNVPTGNLFDFNSESVYNDKNKDINIRFRTSGFMAFEDIIKFEFNKVTALFNPDMRKLLTLDEAGGNADINLRENPNKVYRVPGSSMVKLPYSLANMIDSMIPTNNSYYNLNHRAYPWINLTTNELEWWVKSNKFNQEATDQFMALAVQNNITLETGSSAYDGD